MDALYILFLSSFVKLSLFSIHVANKVGGTSVNVHILNDNKSRENKRVTHKKVDCLVSH